MKFKHTDAAKMCYTTVFSLAKNVFLTTSVVANCALHSNSIVMLVLLMFAENCGEEKE